MTDTIPTPRELVERIDTLVNKAASTLGAFVMNHRNPSADDTVKALLGLFDTTAAVADRHALRSALTQQAEPESPMKKMAQVLRAKAAAERDAFDKRVQSGEWGPMPDAWSEADFSEVHVATIEGDDAVREMHWNPNVGAFDYEVGTKLYAAQPAQAAAILATQPAGEEAHPDIAKLRSAVNLALTYFGMDEDESNREVFKALREAYAHAASLPEHIDRIATVFGSLRKMAEALDIDVGYLSRLRSGEKADPSDEILATLGLRRTVTYTKVRTSPYEATPLIPRTRSA